MHFWVMKIGLGTEFFDKIYNNGNRKIVCYFAILKYYRKIGLFFYLKKNNNKEKQH